MYKILAILTVKNFSTFDRFEAKAASIMMKYGGVIRQAYEIVHHPDDSGEEIHIVEFPDEQSFLTFRDDPMLVELQPLREMAIVKTEIKILKTAKFYQINNSGEP